MRLKNMKDGGPAYPVTHVHPTLESDGTVRHEGFHGKEGMSLLDFFAAKAMQGLCANFEWMKNAAKVNSGEKMDDLISVVAYKTAQAMLAERESLAHKGEK